MRLLDKKRREKMWLEALDGLKFAFIGNININITDNLADSGELSLHAPHDTGG